MTAVATIGAAVAVLALALLLARRRLVMVTVDGPSMRPALDNGDRVLIRRTRGCRIRPGQIIVARRPWPGQQWADPQPGPAAEATWLIKRVAGIGPDGIWLLGDNPADSFDSRQWGPCPRTKVHGVVVTSFRRSLAS